MSYLSLSSGRSWGINPPVPSVTDWGLLLMDINYLACHKHGGLKQPEKFSWKSGGERYDAEIQGHVSAHWGALTPSQPHHLALRLHLARPLLDETTNFMQAGIAPVLLVAVFPGASTVLVTKAYLVNQNRALPWVGPQAHQ